MGGAPVSLQIRVAVPDDAAEIARLSGDLGYPATTRQIAQRLSVLLPSPDQFIAVAADDSRQLHGWIAAQRRLLLACEDRAEIVGLVVDPGAKRAGVGRRLVAAAEEWAVGRGLTIMTVRSNAARPESHPFYERIGYAREKTQHVYTKQLPAAPRPKS